MAKKRVCLWENPGDRKKEKESMSKKKIRHQEASQGRISQEVVNNKIRGSQPPQLTYRRMMPPNRQIKPQAQQN